MSVINQVLNGLEQRGIQIAAGQSVRPVQAGRDNHAFKWIFLSVALLMALAAIAWRIMQPGVAALPHADLPRAVPVKIAASVPAASVVTATPPKTGMVTAAPRLKPNQLAAPVIPRPKKNALNATQPDLLAAPTQVQAHVQELPAANIAGQPVKQVSLAQQADAQFRKAVAFMQQGRINDALSGFEAALRSDAGHEAARQAQVTLLLENKRGSEAEQVLQDGLKNNPAHSGFAMLLARLQIQRNELDQAIATLENTLPHAGQQADYQAFYAALLQRKSRHNEAAEHYQLALKIVPNKDIWLMGYGISLQALARPDDAKRAYERALETKTLSPELQAFVQQKMKEL